MATTPTPGPAMNHVLVDFENVHHIDPAVIGAKAVSLVILVGAKQKNLDAEMVVKLFEHAASVQLVRLTGSEKNAVDFALAYYLGRAVLSDPGGYFHIVSKDTGYDPLIAHLQSRHIRVRRHKDFSTLTFATPAKATPVAGEGKKAPAVSPTGAGVESEVMDVVLARLRKNASARPKREKTLLSHIKSMLGNGATDTEAAAVLAKLRAASQVRIDDKAGLSYHL